MIITLRISVEDSRVKTKKDVIGLFKLAICDMEQGGAQGTLRNNKTGSETDSWEVVASDEGSNNL